MESFKNRLNHALRIRNIKAVDLANITGISKARISHYTTGKYDAKQDSMSAIAKALHVSEAWLQGFDVPMEEDLEVITVNDDDEIESISLKGLSERDKEIVLDLIKKLKGE